MPILNAIPLKSQAEEVSPLTQIVRHNNVRIVVIQGTFGLSNTILFALL